MFLVSKLRVRGFLARADIQRLFYHGPQSPSDIAPDRQWSFCSQYFIHPFIHINIFRISNPSISPMIQSVAKVDQQKRRNADVSREKKSPTDHCEGKKTVNPLMGKRIMDTMTPKYMPHDWRLEQYGDSNL